MDNVWSYISLQANHRKQVLFLMIFVSLVYLFNFGVNDIWTPNESFYAESVREMFESNNFLDIFYNYEPRYNKPPLTYWLIAISSTVFGLTEFGIRLPIVLLALGSIWYTYKTGRLLYGDKGGVYSLVMMAFSVQLLAVKQYASPEIPLTFFFTLTMYGFIKAYSSRRTQYLWLSYIALGLTVLTKGFPYIIVIGGIIGLFTLLNNNFRWKGILSDVKFLKLHLGIPIVLIIGLSWVIFMYLKDGQEFWEVYYRETFGRALSRKPNGSPFFYLEVISWSILPYSLVFFYSCFWWIIRRKEWKKIVFPLSWVLVMLVIFTIAKGKIPTYMIQAHPGLLLMIVPILLEFNPVKMIGKAAWSSMFLFPTVLIIAANVLIIEELNLHWANYLAPIIGLGILVLFHLKKKEKNNHLLVAAPFWIISLFLISFATVLPKLEKFRPYDEIGKVVESAKIDSETPIFIQGTLIHNIPFYAKRFAERDATIEQINQNSGETLALVREKDASGLNGFKTLWTGPIYDFPSESQFAKFIVACVEAENGNFDKFANFQLVYRP